jgi:AAA+ ATPase superfamily predicted ATPase
VRLDFVNREAELKELDAVADRGGVLALYGQRRVGKTRLLIEWLKRRDGWYSQAIEGPAEMQLQQVVEDLRPHLAAAVVPKNWNELFELLRLQPGPWLFCLDEFPYLAATDRTLPSRLQRWLDHGLPDGCTLVLAGSSTRMMHGLFLHRAAALYGRARKLIQVQPMSYATFCSACRLPPADLDSFLKFSLVLKEAYNERFFATT